MVEAVHESTELGRQLPLWTVSFFALMLLSIAVMPLLAEQWWERNRNKAIVSTVLAIPVLIIFGMSHNYKPIMHELDEYFSFIVLLGSLFVVSGGIFLSGDIRATPRITTSFLAIGAVIANVIGTTGASMLLIRPLLRTCSERERIYHIPIFFIFVVSNIGGCLLPIGDPPLFMGYLRGVPFFWTLRLFPMWLFALAVVLTIFYIIERYSWSKESTRARRLDQEMVEPLGLHGKINLIFIMGILLCVIYLPMPLRELGMIVLSGLSLALTPKGIRARNEFNWAPIVEVAVLFIGIFITMVPALQILEARGSELGVNQPWQFFWVTGGLSSFLDNTPTYLAYLALAQGLTLAENLPQEVANVPTQILEAISVGAVFMGAMTYIGNGPNFMVKVICEHQRTKMPSFFGYMLWSCGFLLPIFILVTLIFFWFD